MIRIFAGASALAAFTLLAGGATPARAAGEKVQADWVQKPTGEEFAAAFPPVANAMAIEGRVILACALTVNGVLADCEVESETPGGMGFGVAALSMTPSFRMRPTVVNGQPRGGGGVRIPISFKQPLPPPSIDPGPPTSARALEIARKLVVAEGLRERLEALYGDRTTDTAEWRAWGADEAIIAAAVAAQQQALTTVAPAWMEGAARGYASLFNEDQLVAALAYAESPAGQAVWRKSRSADALGASLSWTAFRRGLVLGRDIFCASHSCLPDGSAEVRGNGAPPAIIRPDWLERPKDWQIMQATPFLAMALGVPGEAGLRCRVSPLGLMYDCKATHETPRGLGFGTAAIEVAKFYRAQPLPPDAVETGPTVELAIRFPEFPVTPPRFDPQPTLELAPGEVRLSLARQIMRAADLAADTKKFNARSLEDFDTIPSPGVETKTRAEVRAALKAGADQGETFFETERAKQYAGLYTESELRAILAWELSPAAAARRANQDRLVELATSNSITQDAEVGSRAGLIFCASRGCGANVVAPPK